jgi:hypothetical protein
MQTLKFINVFYSRKNLTAIFNTIYLALANDIYHRDI